jgi:hypothetical protein
MFKCGQRVLAGGETWHRILNAIERLQSTAGLFV